MLGVVHNFLVVTGAPDHLASKWPSHLETLASASSVFCPVFQTFLNPTNKTKGTLFGLQHLAVHFVDVSSPSTTLHSVARPSIVQSRKVFPRPLPACRLVACTLLSILSVV